MALDTAKVTTRAYSDLGNVARFHDDTTLDPAVRMEMIGLVVDDYRRAVAGSVGKVTAVRKARRLFPLLWSIADRMKQDW